MCISQSSYEIASLDKAELGGSNVESIDIGSEASEGLLGAVRAVRHTNVSNWYHFVVRRIVDKKNIPDQGVDLDGVNVIELLESLLDLGLVGLDIDDEDEGVLLLDLLQGTLGVERVDDDLVLIETRSVRDRLAGVLGSPRQLKGLRLVEGGRVADLGGLVRVHLWEEYPSVYSFRKTESRGVANLHP